MTMWIKQSTAITVKLGPFVDDADGKTVEDSLTISQADIRLSKNGGDIAQTNNSAGATHDERGYYDVPLDTTDTNTLGRLKVLVSESGALPVWADFMVVPSQVWDSLFGADRLQVHVDEMTAGIITATVVATDAIDADAIADNAINAAAIADGALTAAKFASGAFDAVWSVATRVLTAATNLGILAAADIRSAVGLASANLDTQLGDLPTNAELATSQAAADDATLAAIAALSIPTAAAVADAVWDEARSGHTTGGTFGEGVASVTGNVGGNLTGTIGSLASQAKADVNAEVLDVLNVDTFAQPTGAPAATTSLRLALMWIFKLARNKIVQSSTTQSLYADDGSTVDATASVADDGSVATRGEWS